RRSAPVVLAGSRGQRSCSTATDLAGSSTSRVLPDTVAPSKATGLTCSGCSKVLCAVIALPVSTLPDTEPACSPETLAETLAGLSGSRLDSATYTCPSFARTADPCTAGTEVSPWLYCGVFSSNGRWVASCQGLYISKTW